MDCTCPASSSEPPPGLLLDLLLDLLLLLLLGHDGFLSLLQPFHLFASMWTSYAVT